MANAFYDKGRQHFLQGDIPYLTGNMKVCLVSAGYTFSQTHEFLSDIPGGNIVATSGNFTTKTSTGGVADADDVTFSAVSGAACAAYVVFRDTGVAGTSQLVCFVDTATGLPVTPNGGNITLQWDNGANKIFKL